jgi:hypothetical protein
MRMREYTTTSHSFHVKDGEVPTLDMNVYEDYAALNCRLQGATITLFFHPDEDETVGAMVSRIQRTFRTIEIEEVRNA